MQVIALVGPSGSGKSYRALLIAHEYNAEIIVDDGLAIKGSKILAGISAKKQPTKIGAVKTALFTKEKHATEVKNAIKAENTNKILILGTSMGMIHKIAQRLELPKPRKIIEITDIATKREIEQAYLHRRRHGTHVVPAPTLAVKPRFSGFMIEPFRYWFNKTLTGSNNIKPLHVEHTVVRPTFNYLGRFYIANSVLKDIVKLSFKSKDFPSKILKVEIESNYEGITLNLELAVRYGNYNIPSIICDIRHNILENIEHMTAINVLCINVLVKSLYF